MQALIRTSIVCMCVCVASASVALAAPKKAAPAAAKAKVDVRKLRTLAAQAYDNGDYEKAKEIVEQGLASAPKDRELLRLKGSVLVMLYDYDGALAAYRAYVKQERDGRNRRTALELIGELERMEGTLLEVAVASGPAEVYLDSTTRGVFCQAAPACSRKLLPRKYTVLVERAGFQRETREITVQQGQTTKLELALTEMSSPLTVKVAQPGARITVDGAPYDPARPIAAGPHQVVIKLDGHAEVRREIVARQGEPVELSVELQPVVAVRVEPQGTEAELLLDGKPVTLQSGGLAIPPGPHVLVARAPGFQDRRIEIPAERDAGYKLDVQLDPVVTAEAATEAQRGSGRFTGQRKIALVVGGVGLVAAGTGVMLGLRAGEDDDGSLEAEQRREQRTLQSHLAYGAAGLAVAIAIGLWLDGAPGPSLTVTPRAGDGAGTGLDLSVRF